MSILADLIQLAESPAAVCEIARAIITPEQLALLIVKAASDMASLPVNASEAARILEEPRTTVSDRLGRITFKHPGGRP